MPERACWVTGASGRTRILISPDSRAQHARASRRLRASSRPPAPGWRGPAWGCGPGGTVGFGIGAGQAVAGAARLPSCCSGDGPLWSLSVTRACLKAQ